MAENIHKGHRERVRQKFLKSGFESFADHEKLELLLFYSIPRKNTNELAHSLLSHFKTLSGVFDADIGALMEIDGVTESTAILLKLILSFSREYVNSGNERILLGSTKALCEYFKGLYIGEKN